jgi:hypothetical protein
MKSQRLHASIHFMPGGRTLAEMNTKSQCPRTVNSIPDSFPREPCFGAVSGAQPKVLVRKEGGIYAAGQTEPERLERYEICLDLVQQLLPYCQRKKVAKPAWSIQDIVDKTHQGIRSKNWDFSEAEIQWTMTQVGQGLHEPQLEK